MTFLVDLADVLRAAGRHVEEVGGWKTRGRRNGSSYADGAPTHVMVHHTASNTTPANDVSYMVSGSSDRPVANLFIDRAGRVWVMAAGPTNTNGKGLDTWGGGVPADRMNEYAIGIELGNNGTGEPYSAAQQASVLAVVVALVQFYGIDVGHVRAHFEWAPTRKIDPSGPSRWAPSGGKWNMDLFRADVLTSIVAPLPPPPTTTTTGDIEMLILDHKPNTPQWTACSWTGTHLAHVFNGHADSVLRRVTVPRVVVTDVEIDGIIASSTTVTPCPSTWVNTPRGAAWSSRRAA
jgi:hypothetical protein